MKARRAFLASAAAVVSGGCLGQVTADPVLVLSAKTVKRTESALVPRVSVVDEEVTAENPATVRVTLYNQSFRRVTVASRNPGDGGGYWGEIDSAVSENDQMRLTEPRLAEQVGEPPCWFARFPLWGYVGKTPVPALRSQRRTFAIGASEHGDCLEPGGYRFEQRYEVDDGVADVDWAFELLLSEPGV